MRTRWNPLPAASLVALILVMGPAPAGAGFQCTMTLQLPETVTLGALLWDTHYATAPGYFPGQSDEVACTSLLPPEVISAFNDRDPERILTSGMVALEGFTGPLNLSQCSFAAAVAPTIWDFHIEVPQAAGVNGRPIYPPPYIWISALDCVGSDTCGDGLVVEGEECEDGNFAYGDCCSASCQFDIAGAGCAGDGNPCTSDVCDGAGACGHPNNTDPCDDGLFCTVSDACSTGICSGTPRTCADNDTCTQDSCDEARNACVNEDILECLDPQQECMATKLKADARLASQLLQCQSRVASQNDDTDLPACEAKVHAKFAADFAKAGACRGDQQQCTWNAITCEYVVAWAMTGEFQSRCEGAKRKAASKLTKDELSCHSKALKKGLAADPECISKAQQKFAISLVKAGTCPDGGSPQALVEQYCVKPAVELNTGGLVVDICPVLPPTTTTTTTTVTYETSTTTNSTTSTTLGPPLLCTMTFRLPDAVTLASLQWDTDYSNAPGYFLGEGGGVACIGLVSPQETLLNFNDRDAVMHLDSGMVNIFSGITGATNVSECTFGAFALPSASDFIITVVDATDSDGGPILPTPEVTIMGIDCM